MSKRAGELVRTPHVDDKQRGLPPKTPCKRLWRNPRRRFWQSPKPAGQKVYGAIFRGSLSVRKLRARGSRASNQRASSSCQVVRDGFQIAILSTSSSVISSPVRSYSFVVRGDSCAAMSCAFSIVPPFSRYAVIPVARNVWQHVDEGSPAPFARRFTIRSTSVRVIVFAVIRRRLSTLRKSGDFFSDWMPTKST